MSYWTGVATLTGIYMIAMLGMSILTGFTGLFSMGHAGFMAIGAYTSAENSFPSPIKLFVNNLSQLTSQFAFCEPINIADDQIGVNAFCGTVTLILAVLYLLDKNIKLRERIAKTALLVLLYASFDVNVLNYIWHGFHVQNGLPNRFAFIYIFLMLTMAFDAWRHMHKFKVWQILLAMAAPLAFAIYSAVTGLGERELYTYGITIGLLLLYGMAMLIYRLGKMHREVFRSLFFFLAAVEMVSYAIFGVFCNGKFSYRQISNSSSCSADNVVGVPPPIYTEVSFFPFCSSPQKRISLFSASR